MFTNFVLPIPTWLVAAILVGGFAGLSVLATHLLRQVTRRRRSEGHNEVLGFLFSAVAVLYAVLVAFIVFAVWEQFSNAEDVVNREAATLASLYFDAGLFPSPASGESRAYIRAYTESVMDEEFPAMRTGRASDDTRARLNDIYSVYGALKPQDQWHALTASDSFRRLNDVATLRRQRLQASNNALPDVFWLVLFGGALLTLAMSTPLFMDHTPLHLVGAGLLGATLGAALFLILVLDRPFTGDVAIHPDAFEQTLQSYRAIDQLPPASPSSSHP
jgi:hypothetical protein